MTYSNEAKSQMIGVSEATLLEHGAVSEPVVVEMAIGALRAARADCHFGQRHCRTGWRRAKAGGNRLVWRRQRRQGVTRRECFAGDRESVRRQATAYALKLLWQQFLQNT